MADVIEALIGAFLLAKGHGPAIQISCWLGLINKPCSIPDHKTTEARQIKKNLKHQYTEFEKNINYKFKNKNILQNAFSLQKYSGNKVAAPFDKLLFIGEATLYYLITRYIFNKWKFCTPGELTFIRGKTINSYTFSCLGIKHNLHNNLNLRGITRQVIEKSIQTFKSSMEFQNFNASSTVFILKLYNLN